MFKLNQFYKNPDHLADLLPWAMLVDPGIVLNKDGSLQRTYYFRGPDLESASDEQIISAMAQLNNVLRRLDTHWVVYFEARREPMHCAMPDSHCSNKLALLIDIEHHQRFNIAANNFQSFFYLTLQYLPPTQLKKSLWQKFIKNINTLQSEEAHSLHEFKEKTQRIFDILKEQCFEAKPLSDEETLTYLHTAISNKSHPIAVPEVPIYIDALLADTPLSAGLQPKLGDHFIKTLTIIGFPAASVPAILDRLNHLSFAYRWMTRYIAMDKLSAETQLKRHRQRWFAKRKSIFNLLQEVFTKQESALQDNAAVAQSKEIDEALGLLANDLVSYGYFTCTITVKHTDEAVVQAQIKELERVINGLGFTTIDEKINAVEAWLSSLPGQAYANIRKPLLHTMSLTHLIPFSGVWGGQQQDQHLNASPLFYAYTYGNTPFRFVLHVGDVGHHMIIGPTGSGKSVFLNFMALSFCRYQNARVIIFDKGKSFLSSTRGVNGKFFKLGDANHLSFQPLANINDEKEKIFASEWLQILLAHENVEITSTVKCMLWDTLQSLQSLPRAQRTLTAFVSLLQDFTLRQALQNFTMSGSLGYLFDAQQDNLTKESWLCFEMETLMNMPTAIVPTLSYLFHRLELDFAGEPTILVLDEAWLFLDHPTFSDKIREWLKSLRKKNVSVIFATQSVSDAAQHPIAATLLESCAGRIFLPHDRVLEPQIKNAYLQLGLNEKQLLLLSNAQPKKHYYYQCRLGNRLFSLELGELARAVCAASATEDIHFLNETNNLDYQKFIQQFLQHKQLHWAAETLDS